MREHFANTNQSVHLAEQVLMHPNFDFATNLQRAVHETVQGMGNHAFGRVLHRHHAELAVPGFYRLKDFVYRRYRDIFDRMTEMFESRLLRESAGGTEKGNFQRFFQRQTGRHQFAEKMGGGIVAQRPRIQFFDPPQYLRFPVRAVKTAGLAFGLLGARDFNRTFGAPVDQFQNLLVYRVYTIAQFGQRNDRGHRALVGALEFRHEAINASTPASGIAL